MALSRVFPPPKCGVFYNQAQLQPHRVEGWRHHEPADPAWFDQQVRAICDAYAQAPARHAAGTQTISTDEKTGIQARERAAPDLPVQPVTPQHRGWAARYEYEYIRHGRPCLIANFEVATGRSVVPTVGATRTEADFLAHSERTVASAPEAPWIFITDQLNTHQSESLVRYVAAVCGLCEELGEKGKRGLLQSQPSRAAWLSDLSHRIRFLYTPKHCSWLNQVEMWFSILVRRLLRRGSFASVAELKKRLLEFIAYFNEHWAKPFKWTYRGRPLQH